MYHIFTNINTILAFINFDVKGVLLVIMTSNHIVDHHWLLHMYVEIHNFTWQWHSKDFSLPCNRQKRFAIIICNTPMSYRTVVCFLYVHVCWFAYADSRSNPWQKQRDNTVVEPTSLKSYGGSLLRNKKYQRLSGTCSNQKVDLSQLMPIWWPNSPRYIKLLTLRWFKIFLRRGVVTD